jgi:nicotinamidase-related amidase
LVPVIFIQHETVDGALKAGSEGWKLHADLVYEEGDVIVYKTTPDSFLRTDLEAKLRSLRVKTLIVCGYASEFCVDTTVRRGAALGFPVILASDAHTTHDKDHLPGGAIRQHENATLPNITSFGVPISAVPVKEIECSNV